MERRKLGELEVSAIGLGCATMTPFYGEPDPAAAVETIRCAPEIGIDLIDTSDAYGNGRNEELICRAVEGRRRRYVIASKFGNLRRPDGTPTADGRPEYVRAACERSLQRLRSEFIDLYYIHRVDPTVAIEETVGAMSELVSEGKVRFLGISEAAARTIRRAHATHPMSAVQIEYSLWTRDVEREILPLCRELEIGFVGYSPLGRGFLTGTVTAREQLQPADARLRMPRFEAENMRRNLELVAQLRALARSEGCTPAQLALAWVLSRGRSVVPIAGTSHRRWLAENAAAADLRISDETQAALERIFPPGAAAGARYPELFGRALGL
ncbi:MAG: aldo/keto reductase [Alphaproteobacteria bacterium]|nr:aldo/keto reductase [Alphaproteobacteria bacterium]